jgi:hypothetical protein
MNGRTGDRGRDPATGSAREIRGGPGAEIWRGEYEAMNFITAKISLSVLPGVSHLLKV